MGSYLSIVNNTPDTWQCKIGPDQAALGIAGIVIGVLGGAATIIATGGAAAPLAASLTANGVVSVFGVSTSALASITAAAAAASTTASIAGAVSGFGMTVAKSVSSELDKKGYQTIAPGQSHRWGKMSLSLWQQGTCVKSVIVDERTVNVQTLYLRPIFSGATANSNNNHEIQYWLNKFGTEDQKVVAADNHAVPAPAAPVHNLPQVPNGGNGLGDWSPCTANSQCNNGCCSKQYSNDGQLKCTPGGSTGQCVGGGGGGGNTGGFGAVGAAIGNSLGAHLGDWSPCTTNSQCNNGCCSKQYSNDGQLKCTPGGSTGQCVGGGGGGGNTGGFGAVGAAIGNSLGAHLGDWSPCTTNSQCNNGCCSKQYSNDGQLKCTPGGSAGQCVGGGGGGGNTGGFGAVGAAIGNSLGAHLGDWNACGTSAQCSNGCCSKQFSNDGKLKCTPGGSRGQCV